MVPTSAIKWFTNAKTLECDKAFRQYNWPFIHCLSDCVGFKAKYGGLYH